MEAIQDKQEMFKVLNKVYDGWLNYDFIISYYQNSMYMNWGYWNDNTHTAKEACDNLVDTLMGFIEEKKGNILEVACGAGGATRRLFKFYKPADITAINISEFQLQVASKTAPGCSFMFMDATNLKFEDNAFDNIISVEAAFHFNTRENFFSEAYRVLKPGGKLVMSDILFSSSLFSKILGKRLRTLLPGSKSKAPSKQTQTASQKEKLTYAGHLGDDFNSLEEYENLFLAAGFKDVVVEDITKNTWRRYVFGMYKSIPGYANGSVRKWIVSFIYWLFFFLYFETKKPVDKYLIVSARK